MGTQTILHRRRAAEDRFIKFELERQVAERTTQLEHSNKDLESFCYSVSHDLRTPLRAIDGFSRVLEDECRDALNDEGRRRISTIRRNVQKMAQLIDDLLAFSRMGREVILAREIDMTQLAQEVFEELQTASISNVNARFIINPMPTAWGDSALLRQVWINLLSNAAKFTSGQNDATVEVGCHASNDENVYYVKDNGAGFDMRYYDKLFGVFQRLHTIDQFPGTGVGLAIVQRIVMRHDGRVWATGAVGEGATFYFALPRKPATQPLA
jgi:light-regulated signal transduction histidine kinase (bacteriophytochrome)